MIVKANDDFVVALSENNQIYYWGRSVFEKRISYFPKRFQFYQKIPKFDEIYLTNKHFLIFSPIQFHKVSP